MRIGEIGLGDIAEKAYLPITAAQNDFELILATRNDQRLDLLTKKYNIREKVKTVQALVDKEVQAVFVHTATPAHYQVVKVLLENDIHVYVDKPLTTNLNQTQELIEIAKSKNLLLMVGFNRRFAPYYRQIRDNKDNQLVIFQKNRENNPQPVREVIYDDFIHIIDTLRFILGDGSGGFNLDCTFVEDKLARIVVNLQVGNKTGIGVMDRISGKDEEKIEAFTSGKKIIVEDLKEKKILQEGKEQIISGGSWESALDRKGFKYIIEYFINAIKKQKDLNPLISDFLETHKICEKIIEKINNSKN